MTQDRRAETARENQWLLEFHLLREDVKGVVGVVALEQAGHGNALLIGRSGKRRFRGRGDAPIQNLDGAITLSQIERFLLRFPDLNGAGCFHQFAE